ncbi:galactose-1-phosphate uridylyltransferase [Hydrogenimonas sp.]|nr:galactose-1-phosphate uridylyltransferase [Hydrogenimonas sp.]
MSDIRYDPILDEYSVIAPERLHRPDSFAESRKERRKRARECPFCEGHESMTPHEIFAVRENEPDGPGWKTRVVPNLYKAVKIEAPWVMHEEGIYRRWEGFGAHEIIIDTPRHLTRMDEWSDDEYFNWLYTLRARLNDLRNDIRLLYISLFKNHGRNAASTQPHPHTQLIALPTAPVALLKRMKHAGNYYKEHGENLFDALVSSEVAAKERIVAESPGFTVMCPYASSFAFETAIVSKKSGVGDLGGLNDADLHELAGVMKRVIGALYRELGEFDFNITFNTPPLQKSLSTEEFFDDIAKIWRIRIRILPRLFRLGGFELGSGMQINPVLPEEAAALLRESIEEQI